jgi:peroxiredoxin
MIKKKFVVKILLLLGVVSFIFFCQPVLAAGKGEGITVGATMPEITLSAPSSAAEKEYLGLGSEEAFTLSQVQGKFVLIELFWAFCKTCQKNAPGLNKVVKVIQGDPVLGKDIKVLGIGVGNKSKHVAAFKKKFRVRFPLVPDPKKAAFKQLGSPGYPFTILADSNGKILLTHGGLIDDVDEFLLEIRKIHERQGA